MAFNEDTRVKIPAIITLTRLGYKYLSLKNVKWDLETNIFTDIFTESIRKINSFDITDKDIERELKEITNILDYDDLGEEFYKRLTSPTGIRLIDFENFDNNSFNVVTELTCKNGDDEFRPDITLLINGMPLCFIEVKKPNNKGGIIVEKERMMNQRFTNKKFRRFINISQILMFSNNMEYDETEPIPISGAFYSTTSKKDAFFNHFREERPKDLENILEPEDPDIERFILKDTNYVSIKDTKEFTTNKDVKTPTNRIILSIFSKKRLKNFLKYGITYVKRAHKETTVTEKHIMRYPQFFASLAIQERLTECTAKNEPKKGIIWHTQGSGKTALAYFNVKWLTDYFQKQNIIPKFYFIVDRIDLLTQAKKEFAARKLIVKTVSTREEFAKSIGKIETKDNNDGGNEITVVNIQKFSEGSVAKTPDYNINIQRVYFIDEAHRSYDEKGSFLPNLVNSDRNAVFISLTGTPLIGKTKSTDIWGKYIHKYYYNSSIADGYTLRLMREDIDTQYKSELSEILENIQLAKGDINPDDLYSHDNFAKPMLEYIVQDLKDSRTKYGNDTIGGMVVCQSSKQAKKFKDLFDKYYKDNDTIPNKAEIILHDVHSKDERKDIVDNFKAGEIDLLFVYNMLLTGFDSPRLKKLYIGRQIKDHNLLQTLTRVNRPYKDFRYGYVVDFADITEQFDKANKAYWDELNEQLGDERKFYSNLFKTQQEIEKDIQEIKKVLWQYPTENAELFSQEITKISDKEELLKIKKALVMARELYNIIRYNEYDEIIDKLDFHNMRGLLTEVENHITFINQKEALENNSNATNLLNLAMEDIVFSFVKIKDEELKLADDLKNILRHTRESLLHNFDKKDIEFITLKEELQRLFEKGNLTDVSQEFIKENIIKIKELYARSEALNRKNELLKQKYNSDEKFARLHKRIKEQHISEDDIQIQEFLSEVKEKTDEEILNHSAILDNEPSFGSKVIKFVAEGLKSWLNIDFSIKKKIGNDITSEYIKEHNGDVA